MTPMISILYKDPLRIDEDEHRVESGKPRRVGNDLAAHDIAKQNFQASRVGRSVAGVHV